MAKKKKTSSRSQKNKKRRPTKCFSKVLDKLKSN